MLRQRVVTAVVLAIIALWALYGWPDVFFGLFLLLAALACAWEWSTLGNIELLAERIGFAVAVTASSGVLMWLNSESLLKILLLLAVLCWIAMSLDLYTKPVESQVRQRRWGLLAVASLVLITSVVALFWLRGAYSATVVVYLIALVAAADIGAYFSGRKFGRRKLAEHISAGKTVEGAFGGLLLATLLACVAVAVLNFSGASVWAVWLFSLVAALFSIAGDLFISRAKRTKGVKDSGTILPGHGGVLDRFDGLLAAVPWFAFALLWT